MNKIIDGLEDALKVAKCDHNLVPADPDVKDPGKFQKWHCARCRAIFYTSIPNGHQGSEG